MPILALRKNLARAIREGQPWIFRDALERPPRLPDGEKVAVGSGTRVLASGFWDSRSPIAVRILEPGPVADWDALLRERILRALDRRARIDRERTNAFRWIHGEADRLPGIHVDLYADVAVVRHDGDGARAFYRGLGERLRSILPLRAVVDREGGPDREIEVLENGVRFLVTPGKGGKGGLFLDQRENREEVERLAKGRRVLNLFGYTGGFSLYAARGGAVSTDTVDVAKPALEVARRNFALNGLNDASFHAADAFEFLERAVREERRWDLVITDPPSFAPRKSAKPQALRAYARLHRLAESVTAPGGVLCAASCSSHVTRPEFLKTLRFPVESVRGAGLDHPAIPAFPEGDYLKFAVTRAPRRTP